jgi:hypothetical protein
MALLELSRAQASKETLYKSLLKETLNQSLLKEHISFKRDLHRTLWGERPKATAE